MKLRIQSICILLAFGLSSPFAVGCRVPKASDFRPSKMFSLKNSWPFRDPDQPQEGTPVRVVGTWTDTVRTQAGQKPQRGFGGRLVFYEKNNEKPVLVEGQLVVYAFDETNRDPTDNKPTRRYVFPAEQISQHMSISEVGASYSFWLPWDEAGGPRAEVSLICRFEPKGGAVIMSEQTRHLLPGAVLAKTDGKQQSPKLPEGVPHRPALQTLEGLQKSRAEEHQAQQASYEGPAGSESAGASGASQSVVQASTLSPDRRMTVTSIKLPETFQINSTGSVTATIPRSQSAPTTMSATMPISAPSSPTSSAASASPVSGRYSPPQVHAPAPAQPQLVRPQLVTPQLMSIQPTQIPMGGVISSQSPGSPAGQ